MNIRKNFARSPSLVSFSPMAVTCTDSGRWRRLAALLGLTLVISGCAGTERLHLRASVRQPNLAETAPPQLPAEPSYTLSCPDVVEIAVVGRTDCSGQFVVSAEGRINLGALGEPRVEGENEESLAKRVAAWADVPGQQVRCRVTGFRSRVIYLHGPVKGPPRSVPYRGPETVLNLLRRAGGLENGAALRQVYVVRPNVASGQPPQVFPVNLPAILFRSDAQSNVVVQPFDEIYVGEARRAVVGRALPKWLLPAFHQLCRLWGGCPVELGS